MTYKEMILKELENNPDGLTCQEIVKSFRGKNIGTDYLSGSISSKLNKLVKENKIFIHSTKTGPLKGMVYVLK